VSNPIALSPAQQEIVAHRGSDLQIIACAGAGKTEALSRRVASLIAEGVAPESIIAFTFTEKAGAELKERIYRRVEEYSGSDVLDTLGPMFVGTIHGWCFHALQERVPKYGDYEVIDEHRHAAFLSREAQNLGLKELAGNKHWDGVSEWTRIVDTVGNELLDAPALERAGLLDRYGRYIDLLDRFRFLTFSRVITEAISILEDQSLGPGMRGNLRYVIVDEYQDINPAQERLITLLAGTDAELCVVGDDDQAIYQWRGSDVANIVSFTRRRQKVKAIELLENRRSGASIVTTASEFAQSIQGRLPKRMSAVRATGEPGLVCRQAETDLDEALAIASTVARLHKQGFRYRDIAVLFRSVKTAAEPLIHAFRDQGIPFSAGGRTGLFASPEIGAIGEVFAYLCEFQWRDGGYSPMRAADPAAAAATLSRALVSAPPVTEIEGFIVDWKSFYKRLNTKPIDLVSDYYRFLDFLTVPQSLDPDEPASSALLGSFARFSTLLADYEHIARRGRFHDKNGTNVYRAGNDRGKSFWFGLGNFLLHYAFGSYEDFEGEDSFGSDAVQVLTIHQAKGLEWPIVFLPSLVAGRFPSTRSANMAAWPFAVEDFSQATRDRYAGSDADERRLFYTAMTRARDVLYCSCFKRKNRSFKASPYLLEVAGSSGLPPLTDWPLPAVTSARSTGENTPVEISFSDAATWDECGYRYRLSELFGFQRRLAEELGYGKAVHHALRLVAENARCCGKIPSREEAVAVAQASFYAPFADAPSRERMLASVALLVGNYTEQYADDLQRIWATERPFELHTKDGLLTGRADVILDEEGGTPGRLAIVDYKVAKNDQLADRYERQLRVYTHAGRREGWDVRGAYLHALHNGTREPVDTSEALIAAEVAWASQTLAAIRRKEFTQKPEASRCTACDFVTVCRYRPAGVLPEGDEK
jgi:DNA helicase-2/ATP-dependent DNA helicase PcrA